MKFHIPLSTIQQRVVRKNLIINIHHCCEHQSPLAPIECIVVGILCQMSHLRECLPPPRALYLINLLIGDQPTQKDLIEWKQKYSNNTKCTVGTSYWKSFLKRHRHLLVSKCGEKYELSRHNWTTYVNFSHMYTRIYEEMVCAEVAEPLPTPIWMDRDGNEYSESKALGCQVTHSYVILNFASSVTKSEETLA